MGLKKLKKEEKEQLISDIKYYFEMERGEELGDLAADQMLDFFYKALAPHLYNQGIADARKMVEEKVINLDEDIRSLEQPIGRSGYR
ncbi:DUF2164 domain-containing protein [Thalassobacillus hwangdonensis]|uniref:DUF2164 domain-containing protein n=1 Tax=Thalassobacillus hwangdonensis TaxID=546108 RepID=A0ABW3L045_9BACI